MFFCLKSFVFEYFLNYRFYLASLKTLSISKKSECELLKLLHLICISIKLEQI